MDEQRDCLSIILTEVHRMCMFLRGFPTVYFFLFPQKCLRTEIPNSNLVKHVRVMDAIKI